MSRCAISIVVILGAVTTMAAAARNCTETEERELARRHARCVDSGRYYYSPIRLMVKRFCPAKIEPIGI